MSDAANGGERSLSEMAANERRLASEAAHEAELERPVAAGLPDHPHPDIAAADHLRARGDVRTFTHQERVAGQQASAGESLQANARQIADTRDRIEQIRREAHARGEDARTLASTAEALREETREVLDAARDIQPPDVDRR